MPLTTFDRLYLQMPEFDRQKDFDSFWQKALSEVKSVPLESEKHKNNNKSSSKFTVYDVNYHGYMKSLIHGLLYIPRKTKKPTVIIHIHDYNAPLDIDQNLLYVSCAYFFITLRGHDLIMKKNNDEEYRSPGLMIDNIMDKDTYYGKAIYLDTFRSIDMLRLIPDINCSSIGVMGKGLGAAVAVFLASFSDRVKALLLETPSFCHLPLGQNKSLSDAAIEINDFLKEKKIKRKDIKINLTYFDALNFIDKVTCPTRTLIGFKDQIAPPECSFGLFNRMTTEKIMEIYPDEGNEVGGKKQFQKSLTWLIKTIENK